MPDTKLVKNIPIFETSGIERFVDKLPFGSRTDFQTLNDLANRAVAVLLGSDDPREADAVDNSTESEMFDQSDQSIANEAGDSQSRLEIYATSEFMLGLAYAHRSLTRLLPKSPFDTKYASLKSAHHTMIMRLANDLFLMSDEFSDAFCRGVRELHKSHDIPRYTTEVAIMAIWNLVERKEMREADSDASMHLYQRFLETINESMVS